MRFWKLDGAGNDFVLIEPVKAPAPALARRLCDRRRGVGADGLLIVDRSKRSFDYLNADGSRAFCGNGARCAALWLSGGKKGTLSFDGPSGPLLARVLSKESAAVAMPEPVLLNERLELKALGRSFKLQWWETGVPHAVLPLPRGLDRFDVARIGRAIRFHKSFGKPGANVNFIERRGRAVRVRTYERGVEAETLACGTGAMASAYAAMRLGWTDFPIEISPASGEPLRIYREAGETWLEGPARIVFQGEVS